MKPRMLSMVSLDIPVTDLTDRHTLLFSQERRNIFENNIKVQVCATLHVPSACVTVFVVAPCPDHENCLLASQRVITVKVILSDVVDRFGDVTMKAKDMMIPLAEAAIDPGSKFAAGDLPSCPFSNCRFNVFACLKVFGESREAGPRTSGESQLRMSQWPAVVTVAVAA